MKRIIILISILLTMCHTGGASPQKSVYELPLLKESCSLTQYKWVCPRYRGTSYTADRCSGTACKYMKSASRFFWTNADWTEYLNIIPIFPAGTVLNFKNAYDTEKFARLYGEKIDEVSGELIWNRKGMHPLVMKFKNAQVILISSVDFRTREECTCKNQ